MSPLHCGFSRAGSPSLLRLVLPEVRAVFSFRLGFPKTELYLTQAVAFGEQG